MKAVIMAGGEGKRLRPLTCDLPKPMARLCGRPILEYILELLGENGIAKAVITLGYLGQQIAAHFPDRIFAGVELEFAEEPFPLGTAGGVKNACSSEDDTVLVISGDALCDFSLKEALRRHRETGSLATILTKRVEDPREYGLVRTDEEGRVVGFLEKPSLGQAVTDLANTGVYILSKEALDLIPQGEKYDFASDLFPQMLRKKKLLMTVEERGYWCDIGDLESYVRCQKEMLEGKVRCRLEGERDREGNVFRGGKPAGSYQIEAPVYLGKGVHLESGAFLSGCIVDDGCTVGTGARIRDSVLLPAVRLEAGTSVSGGLLCQRSVLRKGASAFEGSVLGAGSVLGRDSTLRQGVKIWPGKETEDGETVGENIRLGRKRPLTLEEGGFSGEGVTPEFCVRLGRALGSVSSSIAVGGDGSLQSTALQSAFMAGALASGTRILDFGPVHQPMLFYISDLCGADKTVFFASGGNGEGERILLSDKSGLPLTREEERELEGLLEREDYAACPWEQCCLPAKLSGASVLYEMELFRCAPYGLSGTQLQLAGEKMADRLLASVLERLGAGLNLGRGPQLSLLADGREVEILQEDGSKISSDKVLAMVSLTEFLQGRDVFVPAESPYILEDLAKRENRQVFRYLRGCSGGFDRAARKGALLSLWPRDGLMMAVKLFYFLNRREMTLQELGAMLPPFETAAKQVPLQENPAKLLRKLHPMQQEGEIRDGLLVRQGSSMVFLRPAERGRKMKIFVQSSQMETAQELCESWEKMLFNLEGKASGLDSNTDKV